MTTIDTNVVVRFLVNDDADQAARARNLIAQNDIFIPLSVMLETEWVLRDSFKLSREAVNALLNDLIDVETINVEHAVRIIQALEWHLQGLDFADGLHLACVEPSGRMATFDSRFKKRAARIDDAPEIFEP